MALVEDLRPVGVEGPADTGTLTVGNVSFVVYNVVGGMEGLDFVGYQVFWLGFGRDWRGDSGFYHCRHLAVAGRRPAGALGLGRCRV